MIDSSYKDSNQFRVSPTFSKNIHYKSRGVEIGKGIALVADVSAYSKSFENDAVASTTKQNSEHISDALVNPLNQAPPC